MKAIPFCKKKQRIIFGGVLLFIVILLRLPWITSDGGIGTFWGYGYFVTDEGYYTGDGRLGFLTGDFFSPNGESLSFFKMPITNLLAFLSYKIFGLSQWASRMPQIFASIWTWWLVFYMTSRRTAPWIAGILVILISSTPPCLAYERTVSTDFLMGCFAITSFWILSQKRNRMAGFFAGLFFALAYLTKPSALAFIPLLGMISLMGKENRWIRTVSLIFVSIALISLVKFILTLYIEERANAYGLSLKAALVLGDRVTGAPKLSIERVPVIIRSLSVMPRWPAAGKISFFIFWIMGASGIILLRKVLMLPFSRWRRYDVLSFGILAYCVLVSMHIYFNVRYCLPIYCLTPLLIVECRKFRLGSISGRLSRRIIMGIIFLISVGFLFWYGPLAKTPVGKVVYSQYIAPKEVLWVLTWPIFFLFGVLGGLGVYFVAPRFRRVSMIILGVSCGLWLAQLSLSLTPFLRLGLKIQPEIKTSFILMQNLVLFQLFFLFFFWLLFPGLLKNYKVWYGLVVFLYLVTFIINPVWHQSVKELLKRKNDVSNLSSQIIEKLPKNSVIIGDRALNMFVESPFTLIPHATPDPDVFWRVIRDRMKKHPKTPVFIMLDPIQSYPWKELDERKKMFRYKIIGTLQLPSFSSGQLMKTYFAQLFFCPSFDEQQLNSKVK